MADASSSQRLGTACNVVFGSMLVGCGAIAVFLALRADEFLTGPRQRVVFVGLPLLLGAISLAGLRIAVDRKLKLLLLLFSTGFSLLSAELWLLGLESWRERASAEARAAVIRELKQSRPDYDDRSIRTFLDDHWRSGTRIYPRIYQLSSRTVDVGGTRTHPTSHLSDQLILECFEDGSYKVYRSDEYGFTNPPGSHRQRADVVLVGDSFTAGVCVPVADDIAARMRRVIPRTVNLGIGGAGPLWELANLVEYGLPLEPEVVFWLYYEGNDLGDMMHEVTFPELTRYLEDDAPDLRNRKAEIDEVVAASQREQISALTQTGDAQPAPPSLLGGLARSLSLPRIRMQLGLDRDTTGHSQARIELLERVILRARSLVESRGGRFVFVYVPDYIRFAHGSETFDRELVVEMLSRNGVRWIDLLSELGKHPDALSLYPHRQVGHFNADGYAFIADRLLEEAPRE